MKQNFSDIATARFGVHAKRMRKGTMALVQSSAITAEGSIQQAYIDRTDPALVNYKEVDLLRKDDVLLIGKGSSTTAALWSGSSEDTLASGMLFVIRPKVENLLPAYLAAYLNSRPAQFQMASLRKVGTVPVLSRSALDTLEIPVPSLEDQHKLVHLADAAQRAKQHLNELTNAYGQLLDAAWTTFDRP